MLEFKQTDTFRKWRLRLRDERVKAAIASRLDRLSYGHDGDVKSVGGGVNELRIHYGSGYRIYIRRVGNAFIILLCGGDKSTQAKDIALAKRLAKEWMK